MLKQILNKDKIFTAKPSTLPEILTPYGDLYEDFYKVNVKNSDATISSYLVQSGKFYIRDYEMNQDILIDPETLEDVTNPMNPIFVGCDLARELDSTYIDGVYSQNEY